jgi:hypothetical protein
MKSIIQNIKIIVLGLVVALGVGYVSAAWTPAPGTPPNANVDAPINVGSNLQTKLGSLVLGGLGVGGDFTYLPTGVSSVTPGQVLVAANASGKVAWGTTSVSTLDQMCNTTDTGLTNTGTTQLSLLINGKNICSDQNGCSYRIWRYTSTFPQGANFYTSNPITIRQISDGRWTDAEGNNRGTNGDGVAKSFLSWEGLNMSDDNVTGGETSKDAFSLTDSQNDDGYIATICDL